MEVKRILDCHASDFARMDRAALLQSIRAAEGRTVLSEVNVRRGPFVPGLTNAEVARAAGADLILLNKYDLFEGEILGLEPSDQPIQDLKRLVGRPIGVNLEPIDGHQAMIDERIQVAPGSIATAENLQRAQELGFDFILLTGNPKTGVSNERVLSAIRLAREHFDGVIIAGKMHGSGIHENIMSPKIAEDFINQGADVILLPTVGTIPGFTENDFMACQRVIEAHHGLCLAANGASQDYSRKSTIAHFGLLNKTLGADIHHIGCSGTGGIAPLENIMELSIAIRGMNHTVYRMAASNER